MCRTDFDLRIGDARRITFLREARSYRAHGNAKRKQAQTMPYSGPASAWGAVGRAELAYFKMINERGGINGRKVTLITNEEVALC